MKTKKRNFRQFYGLKTAKEKELREVCPEIEHRPGIYFYTRIQPKAYLGKASDEIDRNITHLLGYDQHIDKSLKKRKWYSKDNPYGWKLNVLHFDKSELDEKERYYIDLYQKNGYELLNIESGGTTGKTMINERKAPRGYMDGLKQGGKNVIGELAPIVEKYLTISVKKDNKLSSRMLEKFYNILGVEYNGKQDTVVSQGNERENNKGTS